MKLKSVRWHVPVTITFGLSAERQFTCVHDALDYLEHEWPIRNGNHRQRAIRTLRATLEGLECAERSREVFISACIEADILAELHYGRSGKPAGKTAQQIVSKVREAASLGARAALGPRRAATA